MVKKNEKKPGSPQWEDLCERCGRCCYEKYDYRGRIFYTSKACSYLDPETALCRNYENRSAVHPDCVQLTPEIISAGILPADCPYVRDLENYQAPVIPDHPPFRKK